MKLGMTIDDAERFKAEDWNLDWSDAYIANEKGITFTIILLSIITSLITANSRILESYSVRKSLFKIISSAKVITTLSTITIQLILFYFIEDGLLYGFLGSSLIVFIFYLIISRHAISIPNFSLFKTSLKKNKNFFKFGFPSGLIK